MFDSRVITFSVLLIIVILVSCSGNSSDSSPERRSGALFHEAINVPDSFSDVNIAMVDYTNAIRVSISECMNDKGFDYIAWYLDPNEYNESFGIGLKGDEFAKQFGFSIARSAIAQAEFDSRFNSEEQKNLNSSGPEQSEAYEIALGADLSWMLGWESPRDSEGCAAEAYSSVEPPQWFRYRYWASEVTNILNRRFEADQRSKNFEHQWSKCMSELGYDDWDSQDDLILSLFADFGRLLTFDLADLDDKTLTILNDFTENEIALAVPSYDCTRGFRGTKNRLYEELESEILASHPPQIIPPVVPKMPSLDSNLPEIELDK